MRQKLAKSAHTVSTISLSKSALCPQLLSKLSTESCTILDRTFGSAARNLATHLCNALACSSVSAISGLKSEAASIEGIPLYCELMHLASSAPSSSSSARAPSSAGVFSSAAGSLSAGSPSAGSLLAGSSSAGSSSLEASLSPVAPPPLEAQASLSNSAGSSDEHEYHLFGSTCHEYLHVTSTCGRGYSCLNTRKSTSLCFLTARVLMYSWSHTLCRILFFYLVYMQYWYCKVDTDCITVTSEGY